MLKVGMSEDVAFALLGPPIERDTEESVIAMFVADGLTKAQATDQFRSMADTYVLFWTYGRLKFNSPAMPAEYEFSLAFRQGRIDSIEDPFDGKLSLDGKPTLPLPMLPGNGAILNHFPRFLDLRWKPSSGDYPMAYEVEVDFAQYDVDESGDTQLTYHNFETRLSNVPCVTATFAGANPGRWRVRAKNRLGQSDWSRYRHFEFKA